MNTKRYGLDILYPYRLTSPSGQGWRRICDGFYGYYQHGCLRTYACYNPKTTKWLIQSRWPNEPLGWPHIQNNAPLGIERLDGP